jgi:GGDEF domain-containing protein
VTSIANSLSQLEKLEEVQRALLASYDEILRAAAEYPVEVDAVQASLHRQHLEALRTTLGRVSGPADLAAIHSSFRGELREYQEQANAWLARMRVELRAAAEAIDALSERVVANGNEAGAQLKGDLCRLNAAVETEDLSGIRSIVPQVAAGIERNHQQMRDANHLLIAQFLDEIRTLHSQLDDTRRTLFVDRASGAWNRQKMETRIDELLERCEAFCVILAWVNNLKRLEPSEPPTVIQGALKAMVQRIGGIAGAGATAGRWADDQFAIILDLDAAAASAICRDLVRELSTPYAILDQGRCQHVSLRVTTVVVDYPLGSDPKKFRNRLNQMSEVLPGR